LCTEVCKRPNYVQNCLGLSNQKPQGILGDNTSMSIGVAIFTNASIPVVNMHYITHEKKKVH
jgi:hypothetical protein